MSKRTWFKSKCGRSGISYRHIMEVNREAPPEPVEMLIDFKAGLGSCLPTSSGRVASANGQRIEYDVNPDVENIRKLNEAQHRFHHAARLRQLRRKELASGGDNHLSLAEVVKRERNLSRRIAEAEGRKRKFLPSSTQATAKAQRVPETIERVPTHEPVERTSRLRFEGRNKLKVKGFGPWA